MWRRLVGCFYTALITLGAQQVAPIMLVHLPTEWGYKLSESCYWAPQRWTQALGPNPPVESPDSQARRDAWACMKRHGQKTTVLISVQMLPRWPTPTQLANWEREDETHDPLPADWKLAPEPDATDPSDDP